MNTVDQNDVDNFESQAHLWWDETGPFKPLHQINPHRLAFLRDEICKHYVLPTQNEPQPFSSLSILDVGCGGGLVCEPLSRLGANVTGIDAGQKNIDTAKHHAKTHDLEIDYFCETAEAHAAHSHLYDVVIAFEIVEHVSDVPLFLSSLNHLLKPGGILVMSTLNRTLKSYLLGIIAAEYILRWVPKGTHQWSQFIEPAELVFHLEDLGMSAKSIRGLDFSPFKQTWHLTDSTDVNYFLSAIKPK